MSIKDEKSCNKTTDRLKVCPVTGNRCSCTGHCNIQALQNNSMRPETTISPHWRIGGEKKHPAWERYHRAETLWRELVNASAQAHRLMTDAADELEAAGEMFRDHR